MNDQAYHPTIEDSGNEHYRHRVLIGTPATGLVRIEWATARFTQIIPANWSQVMLTEYLGGYVPLRYQVDDAQNIIIQEAVKGNFEWVLLWEHDVVAPQNAMVILNEYLTSREHPIVSGLYFTRSSLSVPLVFRGRGNGVFTDWKMGDMVWADGVPTGFLLIHSSIFKLMYEEAEPYKVQGWRPARRVFWTPRDMVYDPEVGFNAMQGTSDLDWCTRVMETDVLGRAGWPKHAAMEFPFLVDTRLACYHINPDGQKFPNEDWGGFS